MRLTAKLTGAGEEDEMADVIEFPAVKKRPVEQVVLTGLADVIIFPGVRIEREQFSLADRIAIRKARRTKTINAKADD